MFSLQRLKCIIYDAIISVVRALKLKSIPNTLLLVRTNNIGDYILWRNQLPVIRNSERFKNYKITLLGNAAWKGLFEALDSEYVDEVIWLPKEVFKKQPLFRYKMLRKVRNRRFDIIVNTHSIRNKREDDAFLLACRGAWKIGQTSDYSTAFPFEEGYDKNIYDEIFTEVLPFEFEASRTARFTYFFTKSKNALDISVNLDVPAYLPPELKNKNFFVVFPGSSLPNKIWESDFFAEVINHVVSKYNLMPVFCGSESDKVYTSAILKKYLGSYIDLCGQTSLLQFAGLLENANFLISIDTGGLHIAAAVNCPVFGIFSGIHYGMYSPYPDEHKVFSFYPPDVKKTIAHINPTTTVVPGDYNAVMPKEIIGSLDQFLVLN